MSFFLDNWMLIAVAFAAGAMLVWPAVQAGGRAGTINANDAVMLMNREKAVVIDVCEPGEYAQAHISGAKNVPMGQLEEKLAATVKNKATPLIFVCASGARSNRGVAVARKLGYEKAHSLTGGLGAWRSAGLPIDKS